MTFYFYLSLILAILATGAMAEFAPKRPPNTSEGIQYGTPNGDPGSCNIQMDDYEVTRRSCFNDTFYTTLWGTTQAELDRAYTELKRQHPYPQYVVGISSEGGSGEDLWYQIVIVEKTIVIDSSESLHVERQMVGGASCGTRYHCPVPLEGTPSVPIASATPSSCGGQNYFRVTVTPPTYQGIITISCTIKWWYTSEGKF